MLTRCELPRQTYNFFIKGIGRALKLDLCMEVFELMERNGVEPNFLSRAFVL